MGGSVSTASVSVATVSSDGGFASSNRSPDAKSANSTVDGSRLRRPILLSVGGASPVVVKPGADSGPVLTSATGSEAQKQLAVGLEPQSTGMIANERSPPPPPTVPRDVSLAAAETLAPIQGSSMAGTGHLASSLARSKSSSSCASSNLRAPTFALEVVPPVPPPHPRSAASSVDARVNERLRAGSSSRRPELSTALSDGSVLSVGDSVRLFDAMLEESSTSVHTSQAAAAAKKGATGVVFVLPCDAPEEELESEPFDAVGFLPETEQNCSGSRRRGPRIGTQREVLVGGLFDESVLQSAPRHAADPNGESSLCDDDDDDDTQEHGDSPLSTQQQRERTRKRTSTSATPTYS